MWQIGWSGTSSEALAAWWCHLHSTEKVSDCYRGKLAVVESKKKNSEIPSLCICIVVDKKMKAYFPYI